jgi:hypothetical protein
MSSLDTSQSDPLTKSFLRFIEEETKAETVKIMKHYQEKMNADLEAVRTRIVAQAGVRLSSMMSIEDLGRTIRIEITKESK